jgi:adenine specific DNA methylase mod
MLAAAVAKLEGFNYSPSDACFWKQSQSTENSYLFVTDRIIDVNFLKRIHDEMKDDEFLLISCSSFDSGCAELFSNIRLKKIPDSLLGKCEYGSNGYPLNIVNPPVCDGEDIDEDEE